MEPKIRHEEIRQRNDFLWFFRNDGELGERLKVLTVVVILELGAFGIGGVAVQKVVELFQADEQHREELASQLGIDTIRTPVPELDP